MTTGTVETDIPCPCDGGDAACGLCDGSGVVDPLRPATVQGGLRSWVYAARYAAGLPLWRDEDQANPPPVFRESRFETPVVRTTDRAASWLFARDKTSG